MTVSIDIIGLQPKASAYKVGVGGSLSIMVKPSGVKLWRFKYRFKGKESQLSFGRYPDVSFEQAVIERDKAKSLVKAGLNPSEVRRLARKNDSSSSVDFLMRISRGGELIVENELSAIKLNIEQTAALKVFLNAQQANASSPQEKAGASA